MLSLLQSMMRSLATLPDWLLFFGVPALTIVVSAILAFVRAKEAFLPVAVALGGIGLFFADCIASGRGTTAWIAFYLVIASISYSFFFIRRPKREKGDRNEEIYRAFHADLEIGESGALPVSEEAEAGELQLAHVDELIEALKAIDLSPTDRLELDGISRTIDLFRDKGLTPEERRTLNDCLGSVLKLTAKYRL